MVQNARYFIPFNLDSLSWCMIKTCLHFLLFFYFDLAVNGAALHMNRPHSFTPKYMAHFTNSKQPMSGAFPW